MSRQIDMMPGPSREEESCSACGARIEAGSQRIRVKVTKHPEQSACNSECCERLVQRLSGLDPSKYRGRP